MRITFLDVRRVTLRRRKSNVRVRVPQSAHVYDRRSRKVNMWTISTKEDDSVCLAIFRGKRAVGDEAMAINV